MHLLRRQKNAVAHAPTGVDSDDAHLREAVRPLARATRALAAGNVRVHRTAVAGLEVADGVAGLDNLHRKLMPENAWICEKRLRTLEGVEIGAADPDHQYPSVLRPVPASPAARFR